MMDCYTRELELDSIVTLKTLLQESDVTQLTLQNGHTMIHMTRQCDGQSEPVKPVSPQDTVATAPQSLLSAHVGRLQLHHPVLSFPKVVNAGDLLAMINIGILQIPVRAPHTALVELADVTEGQVVEFATELFKYNSVIGD